MADISDLSSPTGPPSQPLPPSGLPALLSGQAAQEFASFAEHTGEYLAEVARRNPDYSLRVRRTAEDEIKIFVRFQDSPHCLLNLDSLGRVTQINSRDASLVSRFSKELPLSIADLLPRVGLQGVPSDHPKMSTLYDPKAVQQKNFQLLQEKTPAPLAEKLLAQTDALKSTLADLKGRLQTLPEQKSLQGAEERLTAVSQAFRQDGTRLNQMELQSCADYISSMRPSGADAHGYLESLNSASYHQAFNDRLREFGKVVYSHGQPIWSVPSTLASGWLSSPAIRGLKAGTDCGFVNICVCAHNAGGVNGNESLSYAGSSPVHPPGVLFLIEPSPLDNFAGQPATRNVVFRPGDSDGRLLKILVAAEMLPSVRDWLKKANLNPNLAVEYFDFVGGGKPTAPAPLEEWLIPPSGHQ